MSEGGLAEATEGEEAGEGEGWSQEELRNKFPSVFGKKASTPPPAPTLDAETAHIHNSARRRYGGFQSSAGYGEAVGVQVGVGPSFAAQLD